MRITGMVALAALAALAPAQEKELAASPAELEAKASAIRAEKRLQEDIARLKKEIARLQYELACAELATKVSRREIRRRYSYTVRAIARCDAAIHYNEGYIENASDALSIYQAKQELRRSRKQKKRLDADLKRWTRVGYYKGLRFKRRR